MPQFAAVSRERHGLKKWVRFAHYGFAAGAAIAPIAGVELARAALAMPCAFIKESGRYTLVALLSLSPGRNMFVGPDGTWLGAYVPAWFRLYPFRMLPQQGGDKGALCVNEESGVVVEGNAAGEAFFDADGNYAPSLKPIIEALTVGERSRQGTDLAVAALAEAGLIRPWPITLKTEQGEQPVSGLHRVDEGALVALPDDAFLKLRAALPIAYAQMLSAGQIGVFQHLARLHNQMAPPRPAAALPETLDVLFELPSSNTVQFG